MHTKKEKPEKEYTVLELLSESFENYYRMKRLRMMFPICLIIGASGIFMAAVGMPLKAVVLICFLLSFGILWILWAI